MTQFLTLETSNFTMTKNVLHREHSISANKMGSTNMPLDPGSRSTETTAFIQCIDGQEPRSMNCGVWVWTTPAKKYILQRKYM